MHPHIHARHMPDKPAVIMASGVTVTYRELDERSNQVARLLRDKGLVPGDRVAIHLENHPRFFELCWGAQRSGMIYVCISTRLSTADAAYIVEDSGARLLVTSYAQRDVARALLHQTPGVRARLMIDGSVEGYASYERDLSSQSTTRIEEETTGCDMLYSSGTTGRPKGVFAQPRDSNIEAPTLVTELCRALYQYDASMRYLSPAPLYHAAPLRFSLSTQAVGGTAVVMEHFDAERFLQLVESYRITHTQLVPTMFSRMLKLPASVRERYDVSSLRIAIHAAAPCPVQVKQRMIEWWGPILWEYYSGTEANGFVSVNSTDWLEHKGTVGRALVGQLRICDPSGELLPPGKPGIIYFADGRPFRYHNDPVKTAQACHPIHKTWTTLGDIGHVDEDGYLFLTDRLANVVISGGVNIYPLEVENLLVTHPKVLDVAVIGVPNEDFGEEVKAVVQPMNADEAGPALAEELIAFCRANLAAIKCPRSVDFVLELPRLPTGKLLKRILRDRYWKGHPTKLV
ncbi:AMP-binding protein [Paraburkholderia sp. CNPSo 3274]|uniref:AMP-binding protein n=1 Tax=Paraburkholderia sp. CNPSo 3274 TaxID=2940932 RepID=UPI0020B75910|nr:AMP-binding protein [Paraburkholderia sp. CNPSo 3274]MCP3713342.1 AMP-binding protein [Paraburkholderia sp. CNPSo 3274]